ncbi:MAG TPA: hypothetical protein VGN17_25455 [Bryobacteraceae bacterium]|jgi:hypothetical protein
MRTTLTLDADVAALLEKAQASGNKTFKETVNAALRLGLLKMMAAPEARRPFRTRILPTGPRAVADISNTAEILSLVEREDYR